MKSKYKAIKEVRGYSSAYPYICNLKLLPNIDGTWITIQDDVGTSMTIKLSDLSDYVCCEISNAMIKEEIKTEISDYEGCADFHEGIRFGLRTALEIIDKYKAESEEYKMIDCNGNDVTQEAKDFFDGLEEKLIESKRQFENCDKCKQEFNKKIDKMRAEIEEIYLNITYKENHKVGGSLGLRKAMEIIDKYKEDYE